MSIRTGVLRLSPPPNRNIGYPCWSIFPLLIGLGHEISNQLHCHVSFYLLRKIVRRHQSCILAVSQEVSPGRLSQWYGRPSLPTLIMGWGPQLGSTSLHLCGPGCSNGPTQLDFHVTLKSNAPSLFWNACSSGPL